MSLTEPYSCPHCLRKYKLSANLKKHVGICQFLQQTRQQQDETEEHTEKTPTLPELFHIVQYLSLRIDKLEKENAQLKKHQSKNMNILEWLKSQKTQPTMALGEWVTEYVLPEVKANMALLYERDIYVSVTTLFEKVMANTSIQHPFRAFDKKKLVFYVYRKAPEGEALTWEKLDEADFIKFVKQIQARYMIEFTQGWYAENEALILDNEAIYDTYIRYYEKMSKEDNFAKFRAVIYGATKTTVKNVVEYEF
jgi:hypothetical protein